MKMGRAILALAAACFAAAPACAETAATHWPGGARAAIALTYDDAIPTDLSVAIPQLDAAHFKGTFFLEGRSMSPDVVARWRAAGAEGHELANHTVNHPCARGTFDMPVQYNSENYSVETLLTEVRVMNTLLTALDGKSAHAFATPCEQNMAGDADYIVPLQQSGLVTFIRDHRAMPMPPVVYNGFVDQTGAQMIAWVESVRQAGGAGVIVFHGVGGDYLSVSAEAHQQLLAYLAAHPRDYWVTTFSALMAAATPPAPAPAH
jgi:Polysaccharide deacetylase